MLAVVGVPSREARPPGSGEDTLSPERRTAGLLRPHVWVGYQWSHTGFCPGGETSQNRYIRSFVSQPPPVGSRTGARTVGSGGSSIAFALGLSPAPMATSPAPATSNGACGFPALRFPDDFTPRGYGTSRSAALSGPKASPYSTWSGRDRSSPGHKSPPSGLADRGRLYHLAPASL